VAVDRHGRRTSAILEELLPATRRTPLVTILDGHPHTPAFLAAATGTPAVDLGLQLSGGPATSTPCTATMG
jgi:pyruvate dehydrogenase E1 component